MKSFNMENYKCIFFDLDHTLWDYESNSRDTLLELYEQFRLEEKGVLSSNDFLIQFKRVNMELWDLYDSGKIESEVIRKERFKQVLEAFDAYEPSLSEDISHVYLHTCPTKNKLMPAALETVEYLAGKYSLTIVTNGFEDIQHTKLKSMNLNRYFDHVITSQRAGAKKPSREIFDFALSTNAITAQQAIMVGDNLKTDIAGARNASIDTVFYNPESSHHAEVVKHEISALEQLSQFL